MLPVALNTRSQFPLHKQKDIPYLSRPLLLSEVDCTEIETKIKEAFLKFGRCNQFFSLKFHFLLKNMFLKGVSPMFIFIRCLFQIQISLYLILKILLPPLWSDVGRKMLREFHFAGTTCPLKPPLNPWATVPFPVDATFVNSVNLADSTCGASARRTPLLFTPLLACPGQCSPSRVGPTYYFTERRR